MYEFRYLLVIKLILWNINTSTENIPVTLNSHTCHPYIWIPSPHSCLSVLFLFLSIFFFLLLSRGLDCLLTHWVSKVKGCLCNSGFETNHWNLVSSPEYTQTKYHDSPSPRIFQKLIIQWKLSEFFVFSIH